MPGAERRLSLVFACETLGRLEPRPVFRIDVHGDIEMSADGERLWVEVEREGE